MILVILTSYNIQNRFGYFDKDNAIIANIFMNYILVDLKVEGISYYQFDYLYLLV